MRFSMLFVRHAATILAAAILCAASAIVLVGCGPAGESVVTADPEPPAAGIKDRFNLETEFFPLEEREQLPNSPLIRELGRQALLMAARDGLGMETRDQTLGEPFPKDANGGVTSFTVQVRAENAGNGKITLLPGSLARGNADSSEEVGRYEFNVQSDTYNMYTSLASVLAASREELVELLRKGGCIGKPNAINFDRPLPNDVERLLAEMDIVSQYEALRQVHAAIAQDGESPARLGGLVRGYAHLAILTRHHWNNADAVFAARALLYSERLAEVTSSSRLALQHRAYARALVGLHGAALKDLSRLPDAGEDDDSAGTWVELTAPLCHFQREQILQLAEKPELRQLAHQLAFELQAYHGIERWTADAGRLASRECPNAFGIYSEMARATPMMFQRQAVAHAAARLASYVPEAVSNIPELPANVRELISKESAMAGEASAVEANSVGYQDSWSKLPIEIAEYLSNESANAPKRCEPSWSVLANLITEEHFVAVANYLRVSMNAVEYSKQDLVDALLPLIAAHRYAPYIKAYGIDRNRDAAAYAQLANEVEVIDPRANMRPMFSRFSWLPDRDGTKFGDHSTTALWCRDYHLPAIMASLNLVHDTWWQVPNLLPRFQRNIVDLQAISPHAPIISRLEIYTTAEPTDEQLNHWGNTAKSDPIALSKVAALFSARKDYKSAIRAYEQAYAMCPSSDTAIALATAYRAAGQEDQWLPTLERYLNEPDYSLGHASIRQHIAVDCMNNGRWAEAEPHALAAAQTASAWGMRLASEAYEGLGKWAESERWIRANVESYPTYSGMDWYLWCQRTGRGKIANARQYANEFLKLDWVANNDKGAEYRFVDDMLNLREEAALNCLQAVENLASDPYWQTHVVILATRLNKTELLESEKGKLLALAEGYRERDPDYHRVIQMLFADDNLTKITEEEFTACKTQIDKLEPEARCNYQYFLGELLDHQGKNDYAEQCWLDAVTRGPYHRYNATLAGARLVAKHGKSRPDAIQPATEDSPAGNSKDEAKP